MNVAEEQRPRLNPFAFPSDTTFRFALLVVAVLGANLYVWSWIQTNIGVDQTQYARDAAACLALAPTSVDELPAATAAYDAQVACIAELQEPTIWWMLGGTSALLLAAVAIMLAAPAWIARRRRLEPLTDVDAPSVKARLAELADEAGLRNEPVWLWNPLDTSATGLAFGRPGRYAVALSGGLVIRHALDPRAFDAVVRHELAHIRNRDVGLTYGTLAVWYAFLAVAVLPFVLTLLDEGVQLMAELSWRLLALTILVYATRNAVLRSREIYADVRASVADGSEGALGRVLATLPEPKTNRLSRLRLLHPLPSKRLAVLADTTPLFRLGLLVTFGAGVAATTAYESIVTFLDPLIVDPIDLRFVAALTFVPLAIGVVGGAIWRQTFAAAATGRRAGRAWPLGGALAGGFLLGPELELNRIADDEDAILGSVLQGEQLGWALVLVVGIVGISLWIERSAQGWLGALGPAKPRLAATAGLVTGAAALTVFTGIFYTLHASRPVVTVSRQASAEQHAFVSEAVWAGPRWAWQFVMDSYLLTIVQRPYVVPLLALVCAFPLAAALVRPRPSADARWAFLDEGGTLPAASPPRHALRPLAIGALAGLAFWGLALALRFGLHAGVDPGTRAQDAFLLSFYVGTVELAVLVQGAAGVAAAAVSRSVSSVADGLAAAFVAGSIATFGIVGGPFVGGCVDPLSLNPGPCTWTAPASFTVDVYQQVVAEGFLVALFCAAATVGVRYWLERRDEALAPAQTPA